MLDNFDKFAKAVDTRFRELSATGELYVIDADRDGIWGAYLSSFPAGTNPVFRERTEHDCSCCKNFIRNIGNVVAIVNGEVQTVWDVKAPGHYQVVADAMNEYIRSKPITKIYRTPFSKFGAVFTLEDTGKHVHTWNHFYAQVPSKFVSANADAEMGRYNAAYQVLKRGLDELRQDAIDTVLDLIQSNSLYRGEEHRAAVVAFDHLKRGYNYTDAYVWANINNPAARFRNTVIGTLVQDLSDGISVEKAVQSFESKVAPANYKRTSAVITPRMVQDALAKLRDMGLEAAVRRRFAKISDVSVNNVLFVDNQVKPLMRDGLGLQDLLMSSVRPVEPKQGIEITGEDFFTKVLPEAEKVDLYLENSHLSNFMSLTAPEEAEVGQLFQWDNNFAWSYDGDVTDSIRERVKAAGGNINALMRVSLSWFNYDDLDIHCVTPRNVHIYYANRCGILDVDMNAGMRQTREPVENLAFNSLEDGVYQIFVRQFSKRESVDLGFEVEYEYGGVTEHFKYDRAVSGDVPVLNIKVQNRRVVEVQLGHPHIQRGSSPVEKWGVTTQQLVPVDTIMLSPNFWDDQAQGNKHYFFFLKNCRNPGSTRGIYNEFLRGELVPHRKVFEILGSKTKCPESDEQLSGVGFSSTRKDRATFVVTKNGASRTYNVQF